jgi:hypothetical protein
MNILQLFLNTPQLHKLVGILGRAMDGFRLRDGIGGNTVLAYAAANNALTFAPEYAAPDNNLRRRSRVRCVIPQR